MHFANDAAGKKALDALPPHRFVIHNLGGGDVRYLYAEPQHCVCTFIGTRDAYQSYRAILTQPVPQPEDVSADYQTQVSALLEGDPVDMLGNPPMPPSISRTIIRRVRCHPKRLPTLLVSEHDHQNILPEQVSG